MKEFFSHAETTKDSVRRGSKSMIVHTDGVTHVALGNLASGLNFLIEDKVIHELLNDVCKLHDLGKYTSFFQSYLLGKNVDPQKKSHARFGAYVIYEKWRVKNPLLAYWGYFLIKNHHASLHWPKDTDRDALILDKDAHGEKEKLFIEQAFSLKPYLNQISKELRTNGIDQYFKIPDYSSFRKSISQLVKDRSEIQDYFLVNYLFSLLIEADKLDASLTTQYQRRHLAVNAVDNALKFRNNADTNQNRLRSQVRETVVSALEHEDVMDYKLFTLTAPTGIGKTLTALDFALKLRGKLDGEPQIITALPFINIIEQTLAEYENVLKEEHPNILAHYQYADLFRDVEKTSYLSDGGDAERNYSQRRMQLNTWQADIVVTSFVQLLQTMISNRNRMLLKFHHLANAIVIMDEVQNIPIEQAPFIGSMIYYCSTFLNTRFVLMTATKPLIFELAQREIIKSENVLGAVKELLPNAEEIYKEFNRTRIIPKVEEGTQSTEQFCSLFEQNWNEKQSCLIVCNKVNRSLEIFEKVKSYVAEKKLLNPVLYLSTNVLPVDRKIFIYEMKKLLLSGAYKPILVSTQVVEAGVDLDFDCGFRDLGPIDAIVQVAGRINRENAKERARSPLYVFDTGDCADVYGTVTSQQARKALGTNSIEEPDYFRLVDKYFGTVSSEEKVDYSEARARFRGVETLYYTDGLNTNSIKSDNWRISINDFQVIKNAAWYISVFIEKSDTARDARQAFVDMLSIRDKDLKRKAKDHFDRNYRNIFQQHTLPVPIAYTNGLPSLIDDYEDLKILYVRRDIVDEWYGYPDIGFNRKASGNIGNEKQALFL